MSTAPPAAPTPVPPKSREMIIYSHSTLFYWWPVWAAGFIMAIVSFFGGNRLAIIPAASEAEYNRELPWLEGNDKSRDVLVLPHGKEGKTKDDKGKKGKNTFLALDRDGNIKPPSHYLHITGSKNVGVLFCTILLLVIFITNVPLRGLWSVIIIGTIIFLAIIFAILDWWDPILTYLSFLDIRINMGGYLFISIILFILWCLVTFLFDHQIYTVVGPRQVQVHHAIGEGEDTYDATNMSVGKARSDLFRHMILGFGSGDIVLQPRGHPPIQLHNVLGAGRVIRQINELLKETAVVPGQRMES